MGSFPPLLDGLAKVVRERRGEKQRILRDDMRSADWDGGGDLSSGKDATATTGLLYDYSAGALQAEKLYAAGADITDINADNITAGTLTAARIAAGSLDGDKITAGTLDADRITAGTITTDRLVLGSPDNLVTNPGFEADDIGGADDPHAYPDGTAGVWSSATVTPRSGGRAARFDVDSQTGTALIRVNGAETTIGNHPAAAEGDEWSVSVWARYADTAPSVYPHVQIRWHDEDGVFISATPATTMTSISTSYQQYENSGAAPAGTAYGIMRIAIQTGNNADTAFLFDDMYARRKVGTLVIEDQAVDIERMLNPVFAETLRGSWSGTITTTLTHRAAASYTVPSWVGSLSILGVGTVSVTGDSTQTVTCGLYINGGATFLAAEDIISGELRTIIRNSESTITSPGATIEVKMQVGTGTGNETNASAVTESIAVGVR